MFVAFKKNKTLHYQTKLTNPVLQARKTLHGSTLAPGHPKEKQKRKEKNKVDLIHLTCDPSQQTTKIKRQHHPCDTTEQRETTLPIA